MHLLRPWLLCGLLAGAGSALAGGGASSDRVRYEIVAPHVLLEESRLWKLPGFTTDLARETVAAGLRLPPGRELPWPDLLGLHARDRQAGGSTRNGSPILVTLRFAAEVHESPPLPRAQAADVVYCAAYLAGWDIDRVRQTTIPGSKPPTNSAPVLRPKHPIPYSPELAENGQLISATNPPALPLHPAAP